MIPLIDLDKDDILLFKKFHILINYLHAEKHGSRKPVFRNIRTPGDLVINCFKEQVINFKKQINMLPKQMTNQ